MRLIRNRNKSEPASDSSANMQSKNPEGAIRKKDDKAPQEPEIRIAKETPDKYQPPRSGLILLQSLIILFFVVFVSRFWYLQLHHGEDFARQAEENHWRQERISAPRGRIFDVRGRVLADNRTAYGLSIVRDDVRDLPATLAQVSEWTGVPIEQVHDRFRQGKGKVKAFEPQLLVTDLSFDLVARIESELVAWPGLEIVVQTKRIYPEKDLFSHILGYVAEVNEKEMEKNSNLAMGDVIGKAGIELSLDERLRGRKGLYDIEVDASGRMLSRTLRSEPKGGETLTLAIDRDIQQACWDALGAEAGSVIVMEPDTGKIRALVTLPAYDNNLFAAGITHKDWNELRNNERFPLQNRSIQSVYPPGSVWKLLMAAALLENGFSPYESVYCPGYAKLGKQIFRCWKHSGHGSQNMENSIFNSCDTYYYLMAEKLGIDRIEKFAKKSGFGAPTGIDLPHEKSGLVPGREWKHRRYKKGWSKGETFNASIGQGYVLTTPIQIAVYVSALLNGGEILKPQLVDTEPRTVRGRIPAKKSTLNFILYAMRRTASGGTAKVIRRNDAEMGGKTGTAQVVRLRMRGQTRLRNREMRWNERDHAWIATWGRKAGKTYVVIVMVEHGGGGSSVAGPVAKKVYNFLFTGNKYLETSQNPAGPELPGPPLPPEILRQRQKLAEQQALEEQRL